jgi:tRNA/rRNA methyltransferase/tRNA (cytidine32/uridine32-2'-O)-methyltransferase
MNQAEINILSSNITDTLANLGFYKNLHKEEQTRFLHDVISRAGLTESEGRYFMDIFAKAARIGAQNI